MIKVLNVITSMDPIYGGMCQGIRNSIGYLDQNEIISEVVCLDEPDAEYLDNDNFKIFALGGKATPWAYSKNLLPWLTKNITNYQVIIVHGLWQYQGYAVRKALNKIKGKKKGSPKFFVMTHGMMDPYFQKAPERRLKAIRNLVFWNIMEKKTMNNANGILFTCEEELLLARKTFKGYNPKKELNIGYGILPPPKKNLNDISSFKKRHAILPDEEYMLFLSRLHHKKGLLNLLNAYSKGLKEDIKLPKLILAGPGIESEFGQQLYTLVENNSHLKQQVKFIGMISGAEKWASFYGAKAFILPSHQENFGIAVVEALACKCPVIISDKVNIWREIEKGNGGIVSEDTEPATFEALKKYSSLSHTEITKMKESAFNVYIDNFTMEKTSQQYINAITDESI
ncbi:glycosyltransferase [Maribacter dokdonensis]|uniref:glycosyltransferase n=1 Tax=Maribacter dokdonensis TaxID=320912 RepID=UPI0027328C2C|nr:glycosyltransferase [Maribacter dokdonensis]MDP2525781.1 glycosyltransferase [Maribacter dokdonensis]